MLDSGHHVDLRLAGNGMFFECLQAEGCDLVRASDQLNLVGRLDCPERFERFRNVIKPLGREGLLDQCLGRDRYGVWFPVDRGWGDALEASFVSNGAALGAVFICQLTQVPLNLGACWQAVMSDRGERSNVPTPRLGGLARFVVG